MKQAIIIVKCDALEGECGTEIEETIPSQVIVWNGVEYTIDLCVTHESELAEAMNHLGVSLTTMTKDKPKPRKPQGSSGPGRVCPWCEGGKTYVKLAQHVARVHPEHKAA